MRELQCVLSATLVSVFAAASAVGGPISWGAPVSDFWDDASLWDLKRVPSGTDDVTLGFDVPYAVLLRSSGFANTLNITNPGARLDILDDGRLLFLSGIYNDGLIRVNPKGGFSHAQLRFSENSVIEGIP